MRIGLVKTIKRWKSRTLLRLLWFWNIKSYVLGCVYEWWSECEKMSELDGQDFELHYQAGHDFSYIQEVAANSPAFPLVHVFRLTCSLVYVPRTSSTFYSLPRPSYN